MCARPSTGSATEGGVTRVAGAFSTSHVLGQYRRDSGFSKAKFIPPVTFLPQLLESVKSSLRLAGPRESRPRLLHVSLPHVARVH